MTLLRTIVAMLAVAAALTSATLFATTPIDMAAPQAAAPATTTPAEEAPASSTPIAAAALVPATEIPESAPPAAEEPPAPAPAPAEPRAADAELNAAARAALVNIYCTTRSGGALKPLSGSGVMVDSRGVILTNAHIGQYFLLRDYPSKGSLECTIRAGSPAEPRYRAELLYVSPEWIAQNADQIGSKEARGTGEHDFALLYITGAIGGALPAAHPALAPAGGSVALGERMLLAAYPAGFLSGESISSALYPTSAFAAVAKKYTFDDVSHTDLFSVGGSVVSQAGSSGGAAVRAEGASAGALAGLISTALLGGSTGGRDLRAITIDHINRSLAAAGKGSLAQLLAGDLAAKAAAFNADVAPSLKKQLTDALKD